MRALLHHTLPAALLALATGCASINPPPPVEVLATTPPPLTALPPANAAPANGSLFSSQRYRPPLEDPRARLVGDLVTITISEKIAASQNSTSNVSRNPKVSGGITALPFVGGDIAGKTKIGAEYSNSFDGGGKTQSSNTFDSSITTTVSEVLPNGHLVITGEKQVGVNRSVDVLRFSGTIDPRRIAPGNTIDSKYVANVRVISRGMGEQAEAQAMGWLGRFFNTITPF